MRDRELRSWGDNDLVEATSPQPLDETDPWDPSPPAAHSQALPQQEQLGYESEASFGSHAAWDHEDELAAVDPGDQWSEVALEPPLDWMEPDPTIIMRQKTPKSVQPSMRAANSARHSIRRTSPLRTSRGNSRSENCWRKSSQSPRSNVLGVMGCWRRAGSGGFAGGFPGFATDIGLGPSSNCSWSSDGTGNRVQMCGGGRHSGGTISSRSGCRVTNPEP